MAIDAHPSDINPTTSLQAYRLTFPDIHNGVKANTWRGLHIQGRTGTYGTSKAREKAFDSSRAELSFHLALIKHMEGLEAVFCDDSRS